MAGDDGRYGQRVVHVGLPGLAGLSLVGSRRGAVGPFDQVGVPPRVEFPVGGDQRGGLVDDPLRTAAPPQYPADGRHVSDASFEASVVSRRWGR